MNTATARKIAGREVVAKEDFAAVQQAQTFLRKARKRRRQHVKKNRR